MRRLCLASLIVIGNIRAARRCGPMTRGGVHVAISGQFTVGVDFGTLSGRAVVVRASDGAEMASAVHEYAHAVLDTQLPTARHPAPAGLGAAGARRLPRRARERGARGGALSRDRPAPWWWASATDFTACTVLPVLADGTPLCELPDYADRPHAYVKLWKHHAAQGQADRINELAARAGNVLARPLRRPDLERVGVRQGPPAPRGGPRAVRPDGPASSRPRTGSSGSSPVATSATRARPDTRASTRTVAIPAATSSAALNPGFADFADGQARRRRSASSETPRDGSPRRRRR